MITTSALQDTPWSAPSNDYLPAQQRQAELADSSQQRSDRGQRTPGPGAREPSPITPSSCT